VSAPGFIVLGHAVRDIIAGGWRLGGTATFAAVQARRLGVTAGVVTRTAGDIPFGELLPDIEVAGRPSEATTNFENVYERGQRRQRVPLQAEPIELEDVPDGWRSSPVVLLGPVCGEIAPGIGDAFGGSLVGVSAQGWLRELDNDTRVHRRAWDGPPFWAGSRVLFVSDEDIGEETGQLEAWAQDVPVVALTRYRQGAEVCLEGRWLRIDAFPADEADPTGAGDIFATAFLIRYHETGDAAEAARFAAAAAAYSVEGPGIERVATREEIEARMAQHPEIALR
jgi:sugar/nucleoside kinase (ribokinase family)